MASASSQIALVSSGKGWPHRLGHDFRADTVSRQQGDLVVFHTRVLWILFKVVPGNSAPRPQKAAILLQMAPSFTGLGLLLIMGSKSLSFVGQEPA